MLGVVGVGVLGVGALVLVGLDQALTHDLVDADFQASAEPFETGTFGDYVYTVDDGTYRIAPTSEEPDAPGYSQGNFSRVAYSFDLSADIVAIDDPDAAAVGIGCVETGTTRSKWSLFTFFVTPEGSFLGHLDSADATPQFLAEDTTAAGIQPGDQIGLRCAIANPFGGRDRVKLTATVNGAQVLDAEHDMGAADGFGAMTLAMMDFHAGHGVRFDNVTAHVPE